MARSDPRDDAEAYLERHNVRRVFQELTTALIFSKPEDPRAFLLQEIQRMSERRKTGQSVRFLVLDSFVSLDTYD